MTRPQCSRAGCRSDARWRVDWRNPRIHDESRRKTWVACDAHLAFLRDYLTTRGFPVTTGALHDERAAP